jgi:hypothetical protein
VGSNPTSPTISSIGGEGAREPARFGSEYSWEHYPDHFKKGEAMAKQYKSYLEFIETAVASENLKKNDPQKWEEYKAKLKKERFLVKLKVRK